MRMRIGIGLFALMVTATATAFAQGPGAEIYKSKCQSCHGATGMGDSAAGKAMKIRPVVDPAVKKISEAEMIEQTKNGVGKMPAYKGKLTDAQIKDAVDFFRSFK